MSLYKFIIPSVQNWTHLTLKMYRPQQILCQNGSQFVLSMPVEYIINWSYSFLTTSTWHQQLSEALLRQTIDVMSPTVPKYKLQHAGFRVWLVFLNHNLNQSLTLFLLSFYLITLLHNLECRSKFLLYWTIDKNSKSFHWWFISSLSVHCSSGIVLTLHAPHLSPWCWSPSQKAKPPAGLYQCRDVAPTWCLAFEKHLLWSAFVIVFIIWNVEEPSDSPNHLCRCTSST